jgi:hypothetical protein
VRTTGSYPRYNQPKNLFYDLISVSGSSRRDHDSIQFAIMDPIHTAENATVAYQLNGSLALFGKTKIPDQEIWLNELKTVTELDGVRIHQVKLDRTIPLSSLSVLPRGRRLRTSFVVSKDVCHI